MAAETVTPFEPGPAARRPEPITPAPVVDCPLAELRARVEQGGLEPLTDAEALALCLARTAPAAAAAFAARLMARFGSLAEVLGAPAADLERVVPRRVACDLRLVHDLQRRALIAPLRRRPLLGSSGEVESYLRALLAAQPREEFRVLFLDRGNRLIADERMWEGTVHQAPVYPREVVRRALEFGASALILAHNHPGRDPEPSAADIQITAEVVQAAGWLRIVVHDHLLVAGEVVTSFRARGLL